MVLTSLVLAEPLYGQGGGRWFFRGWQSREGLPENTVEAIAQTADGFLWVGTTGGLARFDGGSFEAFDQSNTPGLKQTNIPCLLVTNDNTLWICTEGGGLLRWKNSRFEKILAATGLDEAFIKALFEGPDGRLWVGTSNGIYVSEKDKRNHFRKIPLPGSPAISAITQDLNGRVIVGGPRVYVLDHEDVRLQAFNRGGSDANIKALYTSSDGTVWLGSSAGLWRLSKNSSRFERLGGIHGPVNSLLQTADGTLLIGTSGDGIYLYKNGHLTNGTSPDSIHRSAVLEIFEDRDGSIWTGTQAGLVQIMRSSIEIIHLPGPSNLDFGTVYRDSDNVLWVASRKLFKVKNGVATPFPVRSLRGAYVLNVIRNPDGTLWLGTNGSGLFRINSEGVKRFTIADGLANNFIRIMHEGKEGSIWIGTDSGVSHLTNGTFHNYGVNEGLCNDTVQAIVEDSNHDVWIGTAHGISHLVHDRFVEDIVTRGLKEEQVWSVFVTDDGTLWIGTRNGGLFEYDRSTLHHFGATDGLGTDSFYKIMDDKLGHIWTSGPKGIVMLNEKELRDHAKDPGVEITPQFYYPYDRGEPVQLFGGIQSGGSLGQSRKDVWFPSDHGPVHILPFRKMEPVPRMRIRSAIADGQSALKDEAVKLPASNSNLEIQYTPILLTPQNDIRYRYKLEGFDQRWVSSLQRKTAYYTNLPAGNYRFRVQGYLASHPSDYTESSLEIVKGQRFYKTWWFIALMTALLTLLVCSLYSAKVRRVKAEFQLVLDERVRLAREMHDTILQGCASVSSLLEASANSEGDPETSKIFIEYARSQISATMDEARRAVWNLRNGDDLRVDLGAEVRDLITKMKTEFGRDVQCKVENDLPMTDRGTFHEISMVLREALHNSLVHSDAKFIKVNVRYESQKAVLSIHDNGRGFDVSRPVPSGHYGLAGMKERVQRIGGSFELTSTLGEGTSVIFSVSVRRLAIDERTRA